MPVIFYIHGGGYYVSAAKYTGPEILLDEDVVLVTINYRLGPYGFLTLGSPEYSGNMGLEDQLQALHWVRYNIHNFGGDKDNITIYGHSAGGSSVNFHLLSPQSRGLFKRAIAMSGSAYNIFAYLPGETNHTGLVKSYLTNLLNKSVDDVDDNDIKNWILSGSDTEKFIKATYPKSYRRGMRSKSLDIVWAPTVESKLRLRCECNLVSILSSIFQTGKDAAQPFLAEHPNILFKEPRDVDTLIGFTSAVQN